MYFEISHGGKIMICCDEQLTLSMISLDPPVKFMPEEMHDWKIVGNEFVYDPIPVPDPIPTPEERITVLEEENKHLKEALDLLLSGVTEEGMIGDGESMES